MKKRYDEGGDVIELESKTGRNENIGDDVRERAMAAMAAREAGETEKPAPKAKPKAEAKPKAKAPSSKDKPEGAFSKVQSPFAGKTSSFKKMAAGGSASSRADGCAIKGKTRGKMV
jgi:biotin carboxyl carrier protein